MMLVTGICPWLATLTYHGAAVELGVVEPDAAADDAEDADADDEMRSGLWASLLTASSIGGLSSSSLTVHMRVRAS